MSLVAQYTFSNESNLLEDYVGGYDLSTNFGTLTYAEQDGYPSAYFDGATLLEIPTVPPPIASGDMRTVCVWLYRTRTSQIERILIGKGAQLRIWNLRTNGQIRYQSASDGVNGGTVPVNQWTHVAMTVSGTNLVTYLNGVPQNSSTGALGTVSAESPLIYIGSDTVSGTEFLGNMADFRVYDDQLSASEILDLYNEGPEVSTVISATTYTHVIEIIWTTPVIGNVSLSVGGFTVYTGEETSYTSFDATPNTTYEIVLTETSTSTALRSISVTTPALDASSVSDLIDFLSNDLTVLDSAIRAQIDEYIPNALTHLEKLKASVTDGSKTEDTNVTFIGDGEDVEVSNGNYLLPFTPLNGSGQSTTINSENITYNESTDKVIIDGTELNVGDFVVSGEYRIRVSETS